VEYKFADNIAPDVNKRQIKGLGLEIPIANRFF
jgi:hypothetical protein